MDDLAIRGGVVIDGTGAPGREADVFVAGGRIAAVERGSSRPARRVIDARGQVVAPGFIDIHTHSDFTLPLNPRAESKIRQGVTTEVVGNCGFSAAPALPARPTCSADYLAASAPWLPFRDVTFAEYLDSFPAVAVNTIMQVGHNTLRLMTVGMDRRAATPDELARMAQLLEEALEAGAIGLSSGLFTAPGCYAGPDEILALAQVLARRGATYASHIRNEANQVVAAVREAIAVAEATGIHVQIAHLKLSGTDNWGGARKLLAEIDGARRRGAPGRLRSVSVRHRDQSPPQLAADLGAGGRCAGHARALVRSPARGRASARTSRGTASTTSAPFPRGTPSASPSHRISLIRPAGPSARSRDAAVSIPSTPCAISSSTTAATRAS